MPANRNNNRARGRRSPSPPNTASLLDDPQVESGDVEAAKKGFNCRRIMFGRMDPTTIFLLIIVIISLFANSYLVYRDIDMDDKTKKTVHRMAKSTKTAQNQMIKLIQSLEELKANPITNGSPHMALSHSCESPSCTLPCLQAKSQGYGGFIRKVYDTASPVLSKIPGLAGIISRTMGPVMSIFDSVSDHSGLATAARDCVNYLEFVSRGGAQQPPPTPGVQFKALDYDPSGAALPPLSYRHTAGGLASPIDTGVRRPKRSLSDRERRRQAHYDLVGRMDGEPEPTIAPRVNATRRPYVPGPPRQPAGNRTRTSAQPTPSPTWLVSEVTEETISANTDRIERDADLDAEWMDFGVDPGLDGQSYQDVLDKAWLVTRFDLGPGIIGNSSVTLVDALQMVFLKFL